MCTRQESSISEVVDHVAPQCAGPENIREGRISDKSPDRSEEADILPAVEDKIQMRYHCGFDVLPDEVVSLILEFVIVDKVCRRWVDIQVKLSRERCVKSFRERCSLSLSLARTVESSLFSFCQCQINRMYTQKCRSLLYNLSRNVELTEELRSGFLNTDDLVRMDRKHLATADRKRQRLDASQACWEQVHEGTTMNRQYQHPGCVPTKAFNCPSCKSSNCTMYQMRRKPIVDRFTVFITCLECSHSWEA
mmetsp:Transcript_7649/g.11344  ORF Transcript_7649/g.11344 Transcript_7649/m.11344 type:complete len:250 (-) Transcript_7649:41-790(-)